MQKYSNRKFVIGAIAIIIGIVYLSRLFWVQVVDSTYKLNSEKNSIRREEQFSARGLVFDRNGELIVHNMAVYDLMIVPRQVSQFDTVELCQTIGIDIPFLRKQISKARRHSMFKSYKIVHQIPDTVYAVLQEKLYKYPGFFVQARTLRKYPYNVAANVLGYVSEVPDRIVKRDNYYKSGDYIGFSGIERSYEEVLRGKKGVQFNLIDVHNRKKGSYANGKYDTIPQIGGNLVSSIDIELQQYGELLLKDKIGSIVAIEPSSGEILALVTAPTYSPSDMVGRLRSENYPILIRDPLKPLFNRATMAQYPPGSTFKMLTGLIGLQEKVLTPSQHYSCYGGYFSKARPIGCHNHRPSLDLAEALQMSCNAYFCHVFRNFMEKPGFANPDSALTRWLKHVHSFGFGTHLGTDLESELKGILPSVESYNRIYNGSWNALTLLSLSIGQGEIAITPLQLANYTAAIANRGFYYTPHIIKDIDGNGPIDRFKERKYTTIDSAYFEDVIKGMYLAVNGGWGNGGTASIAQINGIDFNGKTGTAQNPHGENHSIFVGFAPLTNPKIAIAVIVENAGYGSTWAAPIASLMAEKFLTDTVKRKSLEERVVNKNLLDRGEKEQ